MPPCNTLKSLRLCFTLFCSVASTFHAPYAEDPSLRDEKEVQDTENMHEEEKAHSEESMHDEEYVHHEEVVHHLSHEYSLTTTCFAERPEK